MRTVDNRIIQFLCRKYGIVDIGLCVCILTYALLMVFKLIPLIVDLSLHKSDKVLAILKYKIVEEMVLKK